MCYCVTSAPAYTSEVLSMTGICPTLLPVRQSFSHFTMTGTCTCLEHRLLRLIVGCFGSRSDREKRHNLPTTFDQLGSRAGMATPDHINEIVVTLRQPKSEKAFLSRCQVISCIHW